MSDAFNEPPINPYGAPQTPGPEFPMDGTLRAGRPSIPTFCTVVFIISIVLCGIRGLLALVGTAGYLAMGNAVAPALPELAILGEIVSGWAIVVFGIAGNTLLLMRKPAGILFGSLCIVSAFASIGIGVWQISYMIEQFPDGSPERIGVCFGAAIVTVIRAGLVLLLASAILRFSMWYRDASDTRRHRRERSSRW